jgi:GPH family glycoside/pentoside/hexuronide:cation symporter
VPGLVLPIYLTDTLGVAAGLASIVVLLPKVWDILFLPMVGNLSDSSAARGGSRSRFLAIGAVGMLVSFPLMFAVPAGTSPLAAAAWVLVAFLIAASAYGLFQVPYVAMPVEITDNSRERTTLMSWRVGLQLLGILTFGIGAPEIVANLPHSHVGYQIMGVAVAVLIFLGMIACWFTVRRLPRYVREMTALGGSLRSQFRIAWQAKPFRMLLTVFILQALGAGAVLAAAPFFSVNILGVANFGILFGILLVPAALSMPLWSVVGHRLGKRRGFLISSSIYVIGLLGSLSATYVPLPASVVIISFTSVGYAGMQMFPLAMLPDTIDDDAAHSGTQRAGALTGVWTAGETFAFALGPALVLMVLAVTGYFSSTAGQIVAQPVSAIAGVHFAFSVMPALIVALTIPIMVRFPLREPRAR